MHTEAFDYVARFADRSRCRVIELGSRDVNGTPRRLFPKATYTGVDCVAGRGVDVVDDAATTPLFGDEADYVICAEVFEHTPDWRQIVANAYRILRSGGRAVFTCAGPGRAPHPCHDDEEIGYYANVSSGDLGLVMIEVGFSDVWSESSGDDTRATGVKP